MTSPLVFLTATEPSGDLMGAGLMAALKRRTGGDVRFAGVGGERMAAEGLDSLFPLSELAIMGAAELLPRLRQILTLIDRTARAARASDPDIVVTIDAWAFSTRVARRLKGCRFPVVQFVAPKVWAWRPGRARRLARLVDHVVVQLPFEPAFFERYGLATTFVGHPIVECGAGQGDGAAFRAAHGIAADATVLSVLPGSRTTEAKQLLPVFGEAVARLAASRPGLRIVVPTVSTVAAKVRSAVSRWQGAPIVTESDAEKYAAFAASDAAIAASGTVALELSLARVPSVIAYRINPLSAMMARLLITVKYANLVNIILDRPVVPEFLQGACTAQALEDAVVRLLEDPVAADQQRRAGDYLATVLGRGGPPPSERAADAILSLMRRPAATVVRETEG